jgi:hypothetical protein
VNTYVYFVSARSHNRPRASYCSEDDGIVIRPKPPLEVEASVTSQNDSNEDKSSQNRVDDDQASSLRFWVVVVGGRKRQEHENWYVAHVVYDVVEHLHWCVALMCRDSDS